MYPGSFLHVAIKVADLEASTSFYAERVGGEVIDRGAAEDGEGATAVEHVALTVADKRVYRFDRAPYEAAGIVDDVPTGFRHFGFVVDDVAAASEDVVTAGARILVEPTRFGELRVSFLTDPDGVRVELIEHP